MPSRQGITADVIFYIAVTLDKISLLRVLMLLYSAIS